MGTYNSLDQLYKALGKQIESSLSKTANDLVELATKLIWEEFYQAYDPKVYERSYRLLNSVMKTSVKKSNNNYTVEIYLDPSDVDYSSIDALQAFLLASEGYHGTTDIQTDKKFWESFMNQTLDSWRSLLIKNGLNIL
jgi:hypothetical protein